MILQRFRTLTISDHQKHYLESIKYIWKLLDDSTKASIRTELNACILEGKSYNIDCVAMMQEICQVNKSLVL